MNFTKKQLVEIRRALLELSAGNVPCPKKGICSNLGSLVDCGVIFKGYIIPKLKCYNFVSEYSGGWLEHSGLPAHPVPNDHQYFHDKWQNPARYRLINYLISRIDEELSQSWIKRLLNRFIGYFKLGVY